MKKPTMVGHKLMRHKRPELKGLYAIADVNVIGQSALVHQVTNAIKGGASIVQYRNKTSAYEQREQDVQALLEVCQKHQVPLIINDDVALAHALRCDGVHLGRDDMQIREAREILGESSIIGVSCYDSFQNALRAQQGGADYVAFGRFFSSNTKPEAVHAQIELLHSAKQRLDVPIVAIGGIRHDNARTLVIAGADMLAIIEGLFGQEDVEIAAEHFSRLFPRLFK